MPIIVDHTKCSGVHCPMQYTFVIDDCRCMRECPYFTPKIRMEHVTVQHVYLSENENGNGNENGNENETIKEIKS